MASLDTTLTLQADEEAVSSYLEEFGGLLLREADAPDVYWAVLRPISAPEELYYARIAWTTYPDQPASVRYHDGIGGRTDSARAWPVIPGYRIGSWDICKPFTAEGYALHPDWRESVYAWQSAGNPFLYVVQTLQNDLNQSYGGRGT